MLQLNDSASVKKAATGPNPQTRKNTTAYNEQSAGLPSAVNQSVQSVGARPVAQNAPQAPPKPAAAPPTLDYSSDPILQMIMGQQELAISEAKAAALAQQKQQLIAYGDSQLALAVTGDQLTADAAANNPFSTLAQLAASDKSNRRNINESENQQNLFYSSDRGYQLGLAQQAYLKSQADASNSVRGNLSNISANLLAAEQNAYNAEAQAQSDAYQRAIQAAQQGTIGLPDATPDQAQPTLTQQVAATPGAPAVATKAVNTVGNVASNASSLLSGMFGSSNPKSGYAPGGAIKT